jgi:hypothetical protein
VIDLSGGRGQFGRYGGDTDGTFRADLQQVFTADDGRVIGLHHNSATRNSKQLDTACCTVFEVENGPHALRAWALLRLQQLGRVPVIARDPAPPDRGQATAFAVR